MDGRPSFCQYHIAYPIKRQSQIATISLTFVMALYAVDEDDLIFASHAEKGKSYLCMECFGPVKIRRGKDRFPHFYHLRSAPQCRLYSKSEDHLRAQIQLQKSFPPDVLQIERTFPDIGRVADLCWEHRKIVFEIQCSPLSVQEAKSRIGDYWTAGYRTVWLLDDKRYNRRILRPAEEFLRENLCYYVSIKQGLESLYYDQFEIFELGRRVRRGARMKIDLQKPYRLPDRAWNKEAFPSQVLHPRGLYFYGDRSHKALLSHTKPSLSIAMQNWRFLEINFAKKKRKPGLAEEWLKKWIGWPYLWLLNKWIHLLK